MREVTVHLSREESAAFGIEEFVSVIQTSGFELGDTNRAGGTLTRSRSVA